MLTVVTNDATLDDIESNALESDALTAPEDAPLQETVSPFNVLSLLPVLSESLSGADALLASLGSALGETFGIEAFTSRSDEAVILALDFGASTEDDNSFSLLGDADINNAGLDNLERTPQFESARSEFGDGSGSTTDFATQSASFDQRPVSAALPKVEVATVNYSKTELDDLQSKWQSEAQTISFETGLSDHWTLTAGEITRIEGFVFGEDVIDLQNFLAGDFTMQVVADQGDLIIYADDVTSVTLVGVLSTSYNPESVPADTDLAA